MTTESKTPHVIYTYIGTWDNADKKRVVDLVSMNLKHKMDAYLEKIYSRNKDVVVKIKITLEQTHKDTFNGSFFLRYSGAKTPMVYIREHFRKLDDLVNHAFDHFKLALSETKF